MRCLVGLLGALALGGCVIPYPALGPQLHEVDVAAPALVGKSRAQVHALLAGSWLAIDERREMVTGTSQDAWAMLVIAGPYGGGGTDDIPLNQIRVRALVEYDDADLVVAVSRHADPPTSTDDYGADTAAPVLLRESPAWGTWWKPRRSFWSTAAVSADGAHAVTCDQFGVYVMDVATMQPPAVRIETTLAEYPGERSTCDAAFLGQGEAFAVAELDGGIRIRSTRTGDLVRELNPPPEGCGSLLATCRRPTVLAGSADGKRFAYAMSGDPIQVVDTAGGGVSLPHGLGPVRALVFDPGGRALIGLTAPDAQIGFVHGPQETVPLSVFAIDVETAAVLWTVPLAALSFRAGATLAVDSTTRTLAIHRGGHVELRDLPLDDSGWPLRPQATAHTVLLMPYQTSELPNIASPVMSARAGRLLAHSGDDLLLVDLIARRVELDLHANGKIMIPDPPPGGPEPSWRGPVNLRHGALSTDGKLMVTPSAVFHLPERGATGRSAPNW